MQASGRSGSSDREKELEKRIEALERQLERYGAGWMSKFTFRSPACCQHCHGPIILKNTQPQYQEDIVRMTVVRRFDVEVGTCACCGRQIGRASCRERG